MRVYCAYRSDELRPWELADPSTTCQKNL